MDPGGADTDAPARDAAGIDEPGDGGAETGGAETGACSASPSPSAADDDGRYAPDASSEPGTRSDPAAGIAVIPPGAADTGAVTFGIGAEETGTAAEVGGLITLPRRGPAAGGVDTGCAAEECWGDGGGGWGGTVVGEIGTFVGTTPDDGRPAPGAGAFGAEGTPTLASTVPVAGVSPGASLVRAADSTAVGGSPSPPDGSLASAPPGPDDHGPEATRPAVGRPAPADEG